MSIPAEPLDRTLVSVDAQGSSTPLALEPGPFLDLRLSPNGRYIAFTEGHLNHFVWLYDSERHSVTQLTTDSDHHNIIWSADGRHLAFDQSSPPNPRDLMWKRTDGLGPTEQLLESKFSIYPGSWSPDGNHVAYVTGELRRSLWVLPMGGEERRPQLLLDASRTALLDVWEPIFSPDGRWIAYRDRGRGSIDIVNFPNVDQRWTVSEGQRPIWHPNGKGLFYQDGGKMMSVEIQTEPDFVVGTPHVLFEDPRLNLDYDVALDGKSFFMIREAEIVAPTHVNVVLNWFEELERPVPTDN